MVKFVFRLLGHYIGWILGIMESYSLLSEVGL